MLVKAKSKLYIAGEYAVLRKGSYAIIAAVDKYTYLKINKSTIETIKSDIEDKDNLLKYAREQAFKFACKYETLEYIYTTDLYDNGKKFGLGSSASVTVVTIKAILEYLKVNYTKEDLFILSVRALKKAGMNGSMGDVACICYEGLILYKSIDDFENFEIKKLHPKGILDIQAFWSGISASTKKQISIIKDIYDTKKFNEFCDKSDQYTLDLANSIENGQSQKVVENISKLEKNLMFLQEFSGINIVSEVLNKIINKNCARKISGAGLGDFAIEVRLKYDEKRSTYEIRTRL